MPTDDEKASGTPAPASAPQSRSASVPARDTEAQPEMDIETLGRQRPAVFATIWAELGFCFSLISSMLMAVIIPLSPQLLLQETPLPPENP